MEKEDWISVSERFPDHLEQVIVLIGEGDIYWGIGNEEQMGGLEGIRIFSYETSSEEITHWMPLVLPEGECDS